MNETNNSFVGFDGLQRVDVHPDDVVKIRARRQIVTTFGHITPGAVGFVPRQWIEKIVSNRGCSCNGSPNWFTIL